MQIARSTSNPYAARKIAEGRWEIVFKDGSVAFTVTRDETASEVWASHEPDGSFIGYMSGSEASVIGLIDPEYDFEPAAGPTVGL